MGEKGTSDAYDDQVSSASDGGDVLEVLSSKRLGDHSFSAEEQEILARPQRERAEGLFREEMLDELRKIKSSIERSPGDRTNDVFLGMLRARGPKETNSESTPVEVRSAHLDRFSNDLYAGCNGRFRSPPYRFGSPLTEVVGSQVSSGTETYAVSSSLAVPDEGAVSVGAVVGRDAEVHYPFLPSTWAESNFASANVGTLLSAGPTGPSTLKVSADVNVGSFGQAFFGAFGDSWLTLGGGVYLSVTVYDAQLGVNAQLEAKQRFFEHAQLAGDVYYSKQVRNFEVSTTSFLPAGFALIKIDISAVVGVSRIAPAAEEIGIAVLDLRTPSHPTTPISGYADPGGPIRFPNVSVVTCPQGIVAAN